MDENVKANPEAVETKNTTADAAKKAKNTGLIIGVSVGAVILLFLFILVVSLIIVYVKDVAGWKATYALDEWQNILDGRYDHLFK